MPIKHVHYRLVFAEQDLVSNIDTNTAAPTFSYDTCSYCW